MTVISVRHATPTTRSALLAVCGVLAAAGTLFAAEPLSVVSFNLRGDFDGGVATTKPNGWLSKEGVSRRDLVLDWARGTDPDLLGVQEAYRNQVDELGAALPEHAVYAVGRDDGAAAGEHCAIYYRRDRFALLGEGTFWLSLTPEAPSTYPGAACPRIASWVRLLDRQSDDAELLVLNTHWDHVSQEARRHSAGLIRGRLGVLSRGEPTIVLGDLNVPEESEPIQMLLRGGPLQLFDSFRSVFPARTSEERTFHGFRGGREGSRIDYVLHTKGLQAVSAGIDFGDQSGPQPSDHYPVRAVLKLGE